MYERDFYIYEKRRKKSYKKAYFVLIFLFFIGTFLTFFYPLSKKHKGSIVSPLASEVVKIARTLGIKHSDLEKIIQSNLVGEKGNYSIAIKNLKTGEKYYFNEHHKYESASLYKLWIMATAFQQIQNGVLDDDKTLTDDIPALNKKFNISSESAELSDGTISFTVASALGQMITISHNYAALLLTEKVRLSNVKKFLEENGFNESKVDLDGSPPQTTAADIALFFEELYKGQLTDIADTEKMLSLLKAQKLNKKLPKYLPQDIVIAHKTGELDTYSHDAGIVYTPKGDYVIAILTDSNYPPEAEDRIGKISKAVYEYFTLNN